MTIEPTILIQSLYLNSPLGSVLRSMIYLMDARFDM